MKNIHVLPTEKPRIYNSGKVSTFNTIASMIPTEIVHNIYITSDEEIKDGDCIICGINIYKTSALNKSIWDISKKIILTTDQDLIKDGVQSIDDEFLEWFVKNPSCEFVEVTEYLDSGFSYGYKIIIPNEEPKQETLEEETLIEWANKEEFVAKPKEESLESKIANLVSKEPSKFLEESDLRVMAKKYSERHQDVSGNLGKYLVQAVFIDGYQTAKKQMYSEEEVLDLLVGILDANKCFVTFKDIKEWFEQFKNK